MAKRSILFKNKVCRYAVSPIYTFTQHNQLNNGMQNMYIGLNCRTAHP